MHAVLEYTDDLVVIIRWVARIIALILAIVVFIFVTGAGLDLSRLGATEIARAFAFLMAWLGLLFAWRWDGVSGVLITVGALLFHGLDYLVTGSFLKSWVLFVFFLPGLMLLYCWWQTRHPRQE